MNVQEVTLQGSYVRLEPLRADHFVQLCSIGLDQTLWQWTATRITSPAEMRDYIGRALDEKVAGKGLPFVTVWSTTGEVVGCTRFGNIDPENRGLEIGWSWVATPWQRTPVNTEAKYLMMRHAFETMNCIRVAIKASSLNERSRKAILRLGAKEEGILRNHMIIHGGRTRDTVYFSVIDSEWPEVKARLEEKLSRPFARTEDADVNRL